VNDLISVIVSTYNRADALDAVLRSLSRQSDANFEIVVADDGSGPETTMLVAAWRARMRVPLKHAWQEDLGFRPAESRNRAIRASAGGYVVFLDGDCIAAPDFVAAHRALAEPGYFVAGNRVLMTQALTARVLADKLEPENWSRIDWLKHRMRGEANRVAPLMSLPLGPLRKIAPSRWEGARTCNLAVARADLDRIDGFDTNFSGWGLEDSDLAIRLIHAGVRRKDGRYATGVFHLWHREADRDALADNQARLDEVIRSNRVRATRGLSALDKVSA
jgi:glycosyltransferase involved in cell wall biosynthesis